MVGQTEEVDFVMVAEKEDSDIMELPIEENGTLLLSTVHAQFPNAIGLKYKSPTGGWRGIRAADNVLDAPCGGWAGTTYLITESSALKRKSSGLDSSVPAEKTRRSSSLLEDIIVLGLPYTTTEDELQKYFADSCGDLAFHEIKRDRDTGKSRGFGFIRFKTEEAAKEALNGNHYMEGRKLEVRMSKKKDDNPTKLFVGRLPGGTTQEDVNDYFSEFGELSDVFVPNPFRGFGFVTYSSQEDAMKVLRMSHVMHGAHLNITAAEPKDKDRKAPGMQENFGANKYNWDPNGRGNNPTAPGMQEHFGANKYNWDPNGRGNNPTKLFVGRLPHGTTQEDMNKYFSEFGQLVDVFVPNPFRGFGFVTYASQEDATRVLRSSHVMMGARLNITAAEPREEKPSEKQDDAGVTNNYKWNPNDAPFAQSNTYQEPPIQKDVASELKDMLLMLINNRK